MSDLSDDTRETVLQLRLLHVWKSGNPATPDQYFAFSTLWVDAAGTLIEGTSHKAFTEVLSSAIKVGRVYLIRKFSLCEPRPSYRVCGFHQYLVITSATKFEDVTAALEGFTEKAFDFVDFAALSARASRCPYLSEWSLLANQIS